jgi:hypothetical protein
MMKYGLANVKTDVTESAQSFRLGGDGTERGRSRQQIFTGWTVQFRNPGGRGKRYFCSLTTTLILGPTQSPLQGYQGFLLDD